MTHLFRVKSLERLNANPRPPIIGSNARSAPSN